MLPSLRQTSYRYTRRNIINYIQFSGNMFPLGRVCIVLDLTNSDWYKRFELPSFTTDSHQNYLAIQEQDDFHKLEAGFLYDGLEQPVG